MEPGFDQLVTKYGIYGTVFVIALFGLSKALPSMVSSFFSTRLQTADTTARTDIIEMQAKHLDELSAQVATLQSMFDTEITKRRAAEDQVAMLTRRVVGLETQLRLLGHEPI